MIELEARHLHRQDDMVVLADQLSRGVELADDLPILNLKALHAAAGLNLSTGFLEIVRPGREEGSGVIVLGDLALVRVRSEP